MNKKVLIKTAIAIVSLFYYLSLIILPIGATVSIVKAVFPNAVPPENGYNYTSTNMTIDVPLSVEFNYTQDGDERLGSIAAEQAYLNLAIYDAPWYTIASDFTFIVMIAIMAFIMRQVRLLLRSAEENAHFNSENAGRVRMIGIAVIGLTLFNWISTALLAMNLQRWVVLESDIHVAIAGGPDYAWLLGGLLVLILGYIFDSGAELQKDQSLTV